jgi:RNA polymerase sigma-70 factor (ECF subfamily)
MAHRLAASHEADRELAKDLTQDILVAVWRAWPSFRGQCSEQTYVARIAHHRIVSHIARFAARPSYTDLHEDLQCKAPTPEEVSIQADSKQALVRAIRKLPLAYREVAVLLLEGLTVTEVADTLGLTQNAISIRSVRAKQMLREMLKESQ